MRSRNPFSPSFGAAPELFIGRRSYLDMLSRAMTNPHDPYRVLFLEGTRGSGKTVLLHRMADAARSNRWLAYEMHSIHAADELRDDLLEGAGERRVRTSIRPEVALPDGTRASLGEYSRETVRGSQTKTLSKLLVERLKGLGRREHGILVVIDEAQKLPKADAVEICVAVQSARSQGLPIMLVMAGLPGTKARISDYPDCTFMKRAQRVVLGMLGRSETVEALHQSFALVPEIELTDGQVQEIAHFTQGHPYLVQLVGYHLYRRIEERLGDGTEGAGGTTEDAGRMRPDGDDIDRAEDEAYATYREDVLRPIVEGLRSGTLEYLRSIIATMDSDGIMLSDESVARSVGRRGTRELSSFRQRLIDLCIVRSVGRGRLRFLIPYLPRYFSEEPDVVDLGVEEGDSWSMEV